MDAKVPNLILQPLVENAIRHGIAPRPEPGTIEIDARRDNGTLHLSVMDDGPGLQAKDQAAAGIGLANTRARLQALYGRQSTAGADQRPATRPSGRHRDSLHGNRTFREAS